MSLSFEIVRKFDLVDESDLENFEHEIKEELPSSYREFLLQQNGGKPYPSYAPTKSKRTSHEVDFFYGLIPEQHRKLFDLRTKIETYNNRIPFGLIPIASNEGGDQILLGVKGRHRGRVLFWDHENEWGETQDEEPTPYFKNITLIADSFEEFAESFVDFETA